MAVLGEGDCRETCQPFASCNRFGGVDVYITLVVNVFRYAETKVNWRNVISVAVAKALVADQHITCVSLVLGRFFKQGIEVHWI